MKILVIEDEKELSDSICSYLGDEQYRCETAFDFESAMNKITVHEYACIVLDLTLPHGNGLEILHELKKSRKSDGVVIISARNSVDDRIQGLQKGADDYLSKPFHLSELSARVAAVIRRKAFDGNTDIYFGSLRLDIRTRSLVSESGTMPLTRKEYELLVYFISNKNRVVTKEAIVEHLWGDDFDMSDNYDFIYSHIKNLRKKLLQAGGEDFIRAVYGMGYKFSV